MRTTQMDFWSSEFGSNYTDRNIYSTNDLDKDYKETYGYSRTEMNKNFLLNLPIYNVLEVGCNVGNILRSVQSIDLENLYGIELQPYAVEKSKELCRNINIIQGSGFDIPFKDYYFDLVYTSGVLIHIAPEDLNKIFDEMYRVSKRYIWGFEYYSESYSEIQYRGESGKMWKADFAKLFLERYPSLKLVRETKYPYLVEGNIDQMYLLEKV
ncbi:pseudaminic acid biosynthesis-associated methylase [Paenibacillus sp. 1_12]|uniref:pseudaminic acid biosynthesis-associated methylase n=1 Tax=Paenibacillus sp. 1_12 TaxID=1566278 RepID=UPI0008F4466C|nr:pseudaminic acid biosynthesis-associated methylase [Paenibacillus sp. 1_12]SFL89227.1 pseudaminic acid biosynthesis-associated methylase [Paenibacillus sp. 1_12]